MSNEKEEWCQELSTFQPEKFRFKIDLIGLNWKSLNHIKSARVRYKKIFISPSYCRTSQATRGSPCLPN